MGRRDLDRGQLLAESAAVIRCRLRHLEARCLERGYTLADVRPCIVSERDGILTVDEHHPSYPRPRPGLGDYLAAVLAWLGITKPRVEAAIGRPCGCLERQAAMNAAGAKWLGLPPGSTAPPEIDPAT